ncbi:MAG: response regulator [Planctomycetes bacterium]|nr:response regulator [Planctomycetota bacterium]
MVYSDYRALIVDDESSVRRLTARAMAGEGFACNVAADGDDGEAMALRGNHNVVITDLRMPNRDGHTLATNLLDLEDRPAIVVLTGTAEPGVVKDLIARGVEDVTYKPVDYDLFAAKVKALVDKDVSERGRPDTTHDPEISEAVRRLLCGYEDSGYHERRRGKRQGFFSCATICTDSGATNLSCFVRDISTTGIGMLHSFSLNPGMVVLEVRNEANVRARFRTEITWCRRIGIGWYTSGGRFLPGLSK